MGVHFSSHDIFSNKRISCSKMVIGQNISVGRTYFFPELSPALIGFLPEPLLTCCFSFSALSRYCTHLARILSLALSLWASSKTKIQILVTCLLIRVYAL